MTREETQKLMMMIQAAYPNYKVPDKTIAINTWLMMLQEYDYKSVETSFRSYAATDTSGFAPSVGQIVDRIHRLESPDELTDMQAWAMVSKCISHYDCKNNYDSFPPEVQRALGCPEQLRTWAGDPYYNESVASSNFMRAYRTEINRKKEYERLPEDIKKKIEAIKLKNAQICKNENQTRELSKNDFKCEYEGNNEATRCNNSLVKIEEVKKRIRKVN